MRYNENCRGVSRARARRQMSAEKIVLPRLGGPPSPFDLRGNRDNNYIYEYSLLINAICGCTIWHGEKIIPPIILIDFDRQLIKILVLYIHTIRCIYIIQEKKKRLSLYVICYQL